MHVDARNGYDNDQKARQHCRATVIWEMSVERIDVRTRAARRFRTTNFAEATMHRKALVLSSLLMMSLGLIGGCAHKHEPHVLLLPTAHPETAMLRMELDGPEEVGKGDNIVYTIALTNVGPYTLGRVTLHHLEHELLEFDGTWPEPWILVEEDDRVWEFYVGTILPTETKRIEVRGKARGFGSIKLRTSVSYVPFGEVVTKLR